MDQPASVARKIESFFEKYPARQYKKGEVLVQAGEDLKHVIYLLAGQVQQYDISPAGEKVIVNIFKPPAFFPMSWAINKTTNDYFFEAATDISAKLAPPNDVVKFIKDNPDVMFDLLSRVYFGVDGVLRRMAHLMGGGAQNRLVFEIITEAKRFGESQRKGILTLKINETELANRAGLTRETVSRNLNQLSKKNLIILKRQQVTIPDIQKLEEFLGTEL